MVTNRESIVSHANALADMVLDGHGATAMATRKAQQIKSFTKTAGTYKRQYTDPEERVLHRHLNLYRNKLAKAQSDAEKARWQGKVHEQQIKIKAYEDGGGLVTMADMRKSNLDLDGL